MEIIYQPKHNDSLDALDTMYPSITIFLSADVSKAGTAHSTTYGYLLSGKAVFFANGQNWHLQEGNYFAFHGCFSVSNSEDLQLWTVTKVGYKCMPMVGQVEENGRLSYIDGCSDSVLVSMPRMGDPVLNYLHFPSGIYQTQHTHPSIRMGVVIRRGRSVQRKEKPQRRLEKTFEKRMYVHAC